MTGKSGHQVKVIEVAAPRADDRRGIEFILVVETGYDIAFFGAFKLREACCERRPHSSLEVAMVDVEIEPARLFEPRHAPRKTLAFQSERQGMAVVDGA